jgi:cysteine desulfurase
MIYLDHAATTPLDPQVRAAMLPWLDDVDGYGNPASDHALGRRARAGVEHARAQVAALIGAEAGEIVWTSGATEANNLALKGALEFRGLKGAHVVSSRIEHKAVLDTCRYLETQGTRVTYLTPDRGGRIAVEQVIEALQPDTALVSLMWVNNETGVINPVVALAPLLRARGVLFHVDAVQAAGKLPIDLSQLPIDLLSLSAHKLYGPKGVGALFVRKRPRARLAPQIHGGGHEQGMRSGTLATHQIVGMGAAFALAQKRLGLDAEYGAALRERLWTRLQRLSGIHRNGAAADTAPHILNVSVEGVEGEALRASLPQLALSSGSACSSATREPSYVLRALGRDDELAGASLRLSVGRSTTVEQVDAAADQIVVAVQRLRSLSPLWAGPVAEQTTAAVAALEPADNVYGYPDPVWNVFGATPHAGVLAPAGEVVSAVVGSPAAHARLELSLRLRDGVIEAARFRAYGCPVTIAVGGWLADRLQGRATGEGVSVDAQQIRAALEIGEDKAHCALMGEDVLRALSEQIRRMHT